MHAKSVSDILLAISVALWAAPLAAQQGATCSSPGAAFGVTSYQCASCTITLAYTKGSVTRTRYVFQAEPIVLETTKTSVLQPGDVIEAVNGSPIMTQLGADRFTYPPAGATTITLRRGNARMQVSAMTAGCGDAGKPPENGQPLLIVDDSVVTSLSQVDSASIERVEVLKNAAAVAQYGPRGANGVIAITTKRGAKPKSSTPARPSNEPLYIVDGVVLSSVSEVDVNQSSSGRRFGFAIGCPSSCTRATTSDGTEYYKFDGYPPVVALVPGGPAERAGIRLGDLVARIDGKSILGEDGAVRFVAGNKTETLHLTVMRDRREIEYLLKAR